MIRILILLSMMSVLSGCFASNFTASGIKSTLTATGVAVIGTAVAGPVVGVVTGVAAGAAADAVTEEKDSTVDVLETIPVEDRADVLKHQKIYEALEHLGIWVLGLGTFIIFILPLIAGYLMPNGKQRRYRKEMNNMKNVLFDHPDVKMQDFK